MLSLSIGLRGIYGAEPTGLSTSEWYATQGELPASDHESGTFF